MRRFDKKLDHMLRCTSFVAFLFCLLFLGCDPRYGFVESKFELAPESRLPRWFDVSGYQRNDLTMKITIYVVPFGGRAKVVVYGPAPDSKLLIEKGGKERWHPLSEKEYDNKYPNYTIITIDGIEEVFEQRQRGNILYITDDPTITSIK
jgi:hypothetical protein